MPFLNRCIWAAANPGTASFVVSGAAQNGYTPTQCLSPVVSDGATYHYFAVNDAQHEEGDGVWNSTTSTLTRVTIRNSSSSGAKVNFTAVPTVFMGGPVATDMIIPAIGSLTWNVAKTGSDNNPGTAALPFLTIQKAVNTASAYNWSGIYFPTINIATGTYNEQVKLPALLNCASGGIIVGNITMPTNVVIADLGTDYAVTCSPFSNWTINGLETNGTYGGIFVEIDSQFAFSKLVIAGNLSHTGIFVDVGAVAGGFSSTINVTATGMSDLFFMRGLLDLDFTSVTFANAITFTKWMVGQDTSTGFFAFAGGSFINGGNVTITGSAPGLVMANGALFEADSTTKVDGVTLTRSNFPGGTSIDFWSRFEPDGQVITFTPTVAQNFIVAKNGATNIAAFGYDGTYTNIITDAYFSNSNLVAAGDAFGGFLHGIKLGSTASVGFASGANWFDALDTGIARNAAGIVEVNNGTPGTLAKFISSDIVVGSGAIATGATSGFLYLDSCAGTPTGTPASFTGTVPAVYDTTNNEAGFYSGGQWNMYPFTGINTAPSVNVTLKANYSQVVIGQYLIAANKTLTLAANSTMRII